MNKQDLVNYLAKEAKLTKASAAKAVDCFLKAIKQELKKGGKVRFTGFGSFIVRNRDKRTVRNPRDGSRIDVPASKTVKFSSGADLKKAVNS